MTRRLRSRSRLLVGFCGLLALQTGVTTVLGDTSAKQADSGSGNATAPTPTPLQFVITSAYEPATTPTPTPTSETVTSGTEPAPTPTATSTPAPTVTPEATPTPTPTTTTSTSESSSSSGSGVFIFDGTTSDIAQQIYIRSQAGDVIDQVPLETVPDAIQKRLTNLSVTYDDLPGMMQRAVIWDTGFILTPDNRTAQVWTRGNRSMADIAVPKPDFTNAGCETVSCTQPDGYTAYVYSDCSGNGPADMLSASQCMVEAFSVDGEGSGSAAADSAMWVDGGDSSIIPEIRAVKYSEVNESSGVTYELYAVHTLSAAYEVAAGECPSDDKYVSLVVPCYSTDSASDSISSEMSTPEQSSWVDDWIGAFGKTLTDGTASSGSGSSTTTEAEADSDGGLSWWWILIIVTIILLIIAAIVAAAWQCHRLSRLKAAEHGGHYVFAGGRMWSVEDEGSQGRGVKYWLKFANWVRKTFSFFT